MPENEDQTLMGGIGVKPQADQTLSGGSAVLAIHYLPVPSLLLINISSTMGFFICRLKDLW